MKLGMKIGGGFLILLSVVFLIGFVNMLNIKEINELTNHTTEESRQLAMISELEITLLRQADQFVQRVFRDEEEAWPQFQRSTALFSEVIHSLAFVYQESGKLGELGRMNNIADHHKQYVTSAEEANALYLSYRPTMVNQIYQQRLEPLREEILLHFSQLRKMQGDRVEQYAVESNRTRSKVLGLTTFLLIAGLILSVILGGVITYSTAMPIQALQKGVEIIGSGDLHHRVGTEAKDEVGQLSRAFDRMASNLIDANILLEQKVKDRTQQLEEALDKLQGSQQMVQAEKMGAVGTMAAGVAHELNNPMMGILNYVQYCIKQTPQSDKRHGILLDAEHEVRRCMEIVKNLLSFARMDKEGPECFEKAKLEEIVDRVLRLSSYRIEKEKVSVNRCFHEGVPPVPVKQNKIQQVILNLLTNALDAIGEGQKKEIHIELSHHGESVELAFVDTGPGIPDENLEKIMMPFFTTKETGKGTGLGLSVCDSIVKEHGGDLRFESKVGYGTKCTLTIPIREGRIKL